MSTIRSREGLSYFVEQTPDEIITRIRNSIIDQGRLPFVAFQALGLPTRQVILSVNHILAIEEDK